MIYLALALIGFGIADLLRWSPEPVSWGRAALAALGGTAAVVGIAALSGIEAIGVAVVGTVTLIVLGLWSAYDLLDPDQAKPAGAIALIIAVVLALVGLSGQADPVAGDLASWYDGLGFGFAGEDRPKVDEVTEYFLIGTFASVLLAGMASVLLLASA